jgi:BASS family bile acid:Na+ symporter
MLEFVVDYGIPFCLFVLMTIVGTELVLEDLKRVARNPRAVLLGVAGQLIVLPPLVLFIAALVELGLFLTTSLLLLSLCPGGAISNYYSYLARCNVSLAATITALGTLCSLVSIPIWRRWTPLQSYIVAVPTSTIMFQLVAFMVLPLSLGASVRQFWPNLTRQSASGLRWASLVIVLVILLAAMWSVRQNLFAIAGGIALSATLFILGAMLLGWLLAYGLQRKDAPVLVIESAVRNVSIAALVGRVLFNNDDFGNFAGFLTGYFIVEILIMLPYAQIVRSRSTG